MLYLVEVMEGEAAIVSKSIEADTPFRAASIATKRDISITFEKSAWIRVTPPGRPSFTFGYADQITTELE